MRQMTKSQALLADKALQMREATDPLNRDRSQSTGRYAITVPNMGCPGEWDVRVYDEFPDGAIVTVSHGGAYTSRKQAQDHTARLYPSASER